MQPPDKPPGKWETPKSHRKQPKQKGIKVPLSEFPNLGTSSVSASSRLKTSAKEVLQREPIYLKKDVAEHILDISAADKQLQLSPWALKERYLGNQNSPLPDGKFRYIYEAILSETGSVQITHNLHKASVKNSPITHSKCHVIRVLNQQEWGFDLSKSRSLKLKEGIGYNYWDYIQAWTECFYYQNPIRKHSWLISINPRIVQAGYPTWFARWWEKFGPHLDVLPETLQTLYQPWYKSHPKSQGVSETELPKGKITLGYFAEFQITWIWRWDVEFHMDNLEIPTLRRTFYYRWWDGFETEKAVERVTKTINHHTTVKQEEKMKDKPFLPSTENIFQLLCSQIQEQNKNCSMEECRIKVLEELKQQYLSSQTNDSTGTQLITSSPCLAGESQNPEDDIQSLAESDSTMQDISSEDLLDEMIDLEAEKLSRRKSKKNY